MNPNPESAETQGRHDGDARERELALRLVSEVNAERARLGRLSRRVTGIDTRPPRRRPVPRPVSYVELLDDLIGNGDRACSHMLRFVWLFGEERRLANAERVDVIDFRTGERKPGPQASIEEIYARIQRRRLYGDPYPADLLTLMPALAPYAWLVAAARDEALRAGRARLLAEQARAAILRRRHAGGAR